MKNPVWPEDIDNMEFGDDFAPSPVQPARMDDKPVDRSPRKNRLPLILWTAGLLCAGVLAYLLLCPKIGDGRYFIFSRELDLSGRNITTTEGIEKWPMLEQVDLRDNPVSEAEIVALADRLPDCRILFDVTMAGTSYDVGSTQIVVTGMSPEDLEKLRFFRSLETIDARGQELDIVDDLTARYPDSEVLWDVEIGGQRYNHDTRELVVEAADAEDISRIERLTMLERVGIFGSSEYEAILAYRAAHPDVEMEWDVEICGKRYRSDTIEMVIGTADAEDVKRLAYLPVLSQVDARGCKEYDALMEMRAARPECQFLWTVNIGGIEVENTAELIDFKRSRNNSVESLSEDFEQLRYLPDLKKLDMCGCGIGNKQMAAWSEQYPDYKFVWEVVVGKEGLKWRVRTDVQVFSTLLETKDIQGSAKDFEPLFLYCTDLVVLDLGHNWITDISMITNLKKLQGLILTGNPIRDMSPLGELPELTFAELNGTLMSDLSPFVNNKKLKHLDVYSTKVREKDLPVLYDCKQLETLVLYSNGVSKAAKAEFEKQVPGCNVLLSTLNNGDKLRNNPVRSEFSLALKNWTNVVEFVDYQHVTYKEGVRLILPKGYSGTTPEEHLASTQ